MVAEILVSLLIVFVKLVASLVVGLGAIYIGLKMFDRMTPGIDEMEEIKKGNAAVGILMAAVVLSIASVIQSGVQAFGSNINPSMSIAMMALGLFISLINVAFGLVVAVFTIYLALKILDKITVDINETEEFKQGNVAIAVMEAGVLIALSFVIQAGVQGITLTVLNPDLLQKTIAGVFGIA